MIEYYILKYHEYKKSRKKLKKEMRSRRMKIEKLLKYSKFIKYIMKYIIIIKEKEINYISWCIMMSNLRFDKWLILILFMTSASS